MSALKYLNRKNKTALILVCVSALLPQVPFFQNENLILQSYGNYIMSMLLIIIMIMLAYLLGYKNLIQSLENSPKLNTDIVNKKDDPNEDWMTYTKEYLKTLTEEEKEILRYFFDNDTKTQTLDMKSGIVGGLLAVHIIYRASNLGKYRFNFDYNIQPRVWDYLKKNKHLLK